MSLLRGIGNILVYVIFYILYLFLSISLNFRWNIIISGTLMIIFFIIVTRQGINIFKRYKGKIIKIKILSFILNIMMLFMIFISILVLKDFYKLEDKGVALYAIALKTEGESEEYNSKFKVLDYKNNKIFYTEEQESIIELIKEYINEANKKNKNIFGNFDLSTLSIKLDYDKNVFHKRSNNYKVGGYYLVDANSMYLSVEDPYIDVLKGYDLLYDFDFKETFLHEYTHHIVYEFMKKNNIDESKVPIWFIEGVSEYVGNLGNSLYAPRKIIEFEKLTDYNNWNESISEVDVYTQSNYAVSKIANQNGNIAIKNILLNIKNMNFNEAFKKVTGTEFKEFEYNFIKDFNNGFIEYNDLVQYTDNYNINDETRVKCYEKYLEKNNVISAYETLANIYANRLNNYEKAKSTLKKCIENNPSSPEAWRYLALLYDEKGEKSLAEEAFNKEKELLNK